MRPPAPLLLANTKSQKLLAVLTVTAAVLSLPVLVLVLFVSANFGVIKAASTTVIAVAAILIGNLTALGLRRSMSEGVVLSCILLSTASLCFLLWWLLAP